MYDIIIVGGGPGGISAGLYAVSRGLKTLILEKDKIGGMISKISSVTHYTGIKENETGETFSKRIEKQARDAGVEIKFEEVISTDLKDKIKKVKTNDNTYESKVVIIASGRTPLKLNIPGEKEFDQKGIGQNALRDKEKYKDKEVFVIGGSDGALKEALFLSNTAKKVYIVYHGDELGAIAEFTEQVKEKENMEVLYNTSLVEVKGDQKVDEVVLKDEKSGETKSIKSEGLGVFVKIGSTPTNDFFEDLEEEDGYVVVNDKKETGIPGVYAIGDIRVTQVRQISTAVADGTVAAINAEAYLK